MKLKPAWAASMTVGILAAGILITSVTGLWSTKSSKTPSRLSGENYSQSYDPADIRGSYTFGEISSLYEIPLGDLAAAFGIPEDDASNFKCKDLEAIFTQSDYEIGTDSVRMFTAYYLGIPFTPAEDTILPGTAAQVLTDRGNMTPEQLSRLESQTAPAP